MRGRQTLQIFLHVLTARILLAHDAEGRYGVAERGDLVVEVCAVALFDHVVGCLFDRLMAAIGRRRRSVFLFVIFDGGFAFSGLSCSVLGLVTRGGGG